MRASLVGAVATSHAAGAVDPLWAFVTLLIQGESDIVDARGHTITQSGAVANGTAYIAAGAIDFVGTTQNLSAGSTTDYLPGTGQFCFECFTQSVASPPEAYQILFSTTDNGSAIGGMYLENSPDRGVFWGQNNGGSRSFGYGTYTSGVEQHIFVARNSADEVLIGVDGTIRAKITGVTNDIQSSANALRLGRLGPTQYYKGSMRGVRFTLGNSRYDGAIGDPYTVPTLPLPTS